MIKKESTVLPLSKQSISLATRPSDSDSTSQTELLQLSKNQFSSWARKLPTEERYLALRMQMPHLITAFRDHTRKFGDNWRLEPNDGKKSGSRTNKLLLTVYQNFVEAIVLISDTDYLDSLGFQFSFVESPQKIYDLLVSVRGIASKIAENKSVDSPSSKTPQKIHRKYISKLEWMTLAVSQIEAQLIEKINSKWDPRALDLEKYQKREFGNFWKNLSEEVRMSFLFLGTKNLDELAKALQNLKVSVRINQLQAEIFDMVKMEKKDICNRLFKWKLKRTSFALCDYFDLLYNRLKQNFSLTTGKSMNKSKKPQHRRKKKGKKGKEMDACSNQTNETDIKETKMQLDLDTVISNKIQKGLINLTDQISEEANSYFDSRVLGYERLHYILGLCGIQLKLYGSCASGIAIENSDVDAALDQSILSWFDYLPDPRSKILAVFELLQNYFSTFKWIIGIKKIPTAYIPIIKFSIDTSIPFQLEESPKETIEHLNRPVSRLSCVQIDLTIQTKAQTTGLKHLGIISTNQILKWMSQIPCLRSMILILKHNLSKKGLNETYFGGVNTYTLIVMVVSFLADRRIEKSTQIASVFEKFLRFYGWDFNQKTHIIDLRNSNHDKLQIFAEKQQEQQQSAGRSIADLEVRDPLNDGKVMTRNCYKFDQIRQLMREIYQKCFIQPRKQAEQIYSKRNQKEGSLSPEIDELDGMIGRCVWLTG